MSQVELDRSHAHKTLIRRLFAECINEAHLEKADQLISADFINAEGGDRTGRVQGVDYPIASRISRYPVHDSGPRC